MNIEEQYDKIYRYCYFKIYDKQLAQDITQETFLRFYGQDLRLDNNKEMAYLYTIARNLCADEFRKRQAYSADKFRKGQVYSTDEFRKMSLDRVYDSGEKAVSDTSEELINSLIIRNVIERLPPKERELLFLRYVNEISVASICKITGISRFAVYRRLQKTLRRLKEELKKEGFSE